MRDRKKQREIFKEQNYCDKKNAYGNQDITPYNAIKNIDRENKNKNIVLR